jgi:L-ribulose-5-phosphate 4-epimerase
MQNHGVFTIGVDGKSAVKAAVMCEDVAKSAWLASQLGAPIPVPPEAVASLFNRYQNVYGK